MGKGGLVIHPCRTGDWQLGGGGGNNKSLPRANGQRDWLRKKT